MSRKVFYECFLTFSTMACDFCKATLPLPGSLTRDSAQENSEYPVCIPPLARRCVQRRMRAEARDERKIFWSILIFIKNE